MWNGDKSEGSRTWAASMCWSKTSRGETGCVATDERRPLFSHPNDATMQAGSADPTCQTRKRVGPLFFLPLSVGVDRYGVARRGRGGMSPAAPFCRKGFHARHTCTRHIANRAPSRLAGLFFFFFLPVDDERHTLFFFSVLHRRQRKKKSRCGPLAEAYGSANRRVVHRQDTRIKKTRPCAARTVSFFFFIFPRPF